MGSVYEKQLVEKLSKPENHSRLLALADKVRESLHLTHETPEPKAPAPLEVVSTEPTLEQQIEALKNKYAQK